MNRIYLGYVSGSRPQIFRSATTPTEISHGNHYLAVVGPFRTLRGARFMRDHGFANPHCQHVNDAEKLAKKYA